MGQMDVDAVGGPDLGTSSIAEGLAASCVSGVREAMSTEARRRPGAGNVLTSEPTAIPQIAGNTNKMKSRQPIAICTAHTL